MMTTTTLTLTDFLLARIAEDEVRANLRDWHVSGCDTIPDASGYSYPCDCGVPERMRRECEAKRRIVEWHKSWPVLVQKPPTFDQVESADPSGFVMRASQQIAWATEQEYRERFGTEPPSAPILRALAAVYADHADYRDEWDA